MTQQTKLFIEDHIDEIDNCEYAYVLFNAARYEIDYDTPLLDELYKILLSIGIKETDIYTSEGNQHGVCLDYQYMLNEKGASNIKVLLAWQLLDPGLHSTYFDSVCITKYNGIIRGNLCAQDLRTSNKNVDELIDSFIDSIIESYDK